MQRLTGRRMLSPLLLTLAATLASSHAIAHGAQGDHVENLAAHVEAYAGEVEDLVRNVHAMVDAYRGGGAGAARPARLVQYWEDVKFHAAIERTYVPVYAAIWQGLYGVKQAMEDGEPLAAVREQQLALERALWQGLGAVKLAAQQQQGQGSVLAAEERDDSGPLGTLEEVKQRLDEVVAKYAERRFEEARALVHATYAERFEGVEGPLIEQDAALVEDLEKDFNVTLPQGLDGETPVAAVRTIVTAMQRKLDRAKTLLSRAEQQRKDVF